MPTRLSNGLLIYNTTNHALYFYSGDNKEPTCAEVDDILNADIRNETVVGKNTYSLVTAKLLPTLEGLALINGYLEKNPDCLIVGSAVAAQAYPGLVVSPIPLKSHRNVKGAARIYHSNRFTTYKGEQ